MMPDKLPNDLSDKYLLKPNYPENEQFPSKNWLILEGDRLSLDGKECDKIGVSYYAFQNQGQRCKRPAGSCLNNQIKDLIFEDDQRRQKNKTLLYSADRYV